MTEDLLRVRYATKLSGSVQASPSKSYTHRAVIIGSMNGRSLIHNALRCDDTERTLAMLGLLGAQIGERKKNEYSSDFKIEGFGGRPNIRPGVSDFDVGESGTLLRFLLPILALGRGKFRVIGRSTIMTRPNREIVEVLQAWGVDIAGQTAEHTVPICLNSNGRLPGGTAALRGSRSSQVVSSLLIAAPFAERDTILDVTPDLVSRPYVDVTEDVLNWAGVHFTKDGPNRYHVKAGQRAASQRSFTVHGDYSSSAFLMAAAALCPSSLEIKDLVPDKQGDRAIIRILSEMGVDISHDESAGVVSVHGPAALKAVDISGRDIPDLIPVLTTLACFATGTTHITNVAHLRGKESDRIAAPAEELRKLGAQIETTSDSIMVHGGARLRSSPVSARRDHRIAMSLAVAGLALPGGIEISGAQCITKSYPGFIDHMNALTGGALETVRGSAQPERAHV